MNDDDMAALCLESDAGTGGRCLLCQFGRCPLCQCRKSESAGAAWPKDGNVNTANKAQTAAIAILPTNVPRNSGANCQFTVEE